MNATFDALLRVAYAYGGGLLKFGGDALLVFFDGGPRGRAARARLRCGERFDRSGAQDPGRAVTLKMHAGLHCGAFDSSARWGGASRADRDWPCGDRPQSRWKHLGGGRDHAQRQGADGRTPAISANRGTVDGSSWRGRPRRPSGGEAVPDVVGLELGVSCRARPRPRLEARREPEHRRPPLLPPRSPAPTLLAATPARRWPPPHSTDRRTIQTAPRSTPSASSRATSTRTAPGSSRRRRPASRGRRRRASSWPCAATSSGSPALRSASGSTAAGSSPANGRRSAGRTRSSAIRPRSRPA